MTPATDIHNSDKSMVAHWVEGDSLLLSFHCCLWGCCAQTLSNPFSNQAEDLWTWSSEQTHNWHNETHHQYCHPTPSTYTPPPHTHGLYQALFSIVQKLCAITKALSYEVSTWHSVLEAGYCQTMNHGHHGHVGQRINWTTHKLPQCMHSPVTDHVTYTGMLCTWGQSIHTTSGVFNYTIGGAIA